MKRRDSVETGESTFTWHDVNQRWKQATSGRFQAEDPDGNSIRPGFRGLDWRKCIEQYVAWTILDLETDWLDWGDFTCDINTDDFQKTQEKPFDKPITVKWKARIVRNCREKT